MYWCTPKLHVSPHIPPARYAIVKSLTDYKWLTYASLYLSCHKCHLIPIVQQAIGTVYKLMHSCDFMVSHFTHIFSQQSDCGVRASSYLNRMSMNQQWRTLQRGMGVCHTIDTRVHQMCVTKSLSFVTVCMVSHYTNGQSKELCALIYMHDAP